MRILLHVSHASLQRSLVSAFVSRAHEVRLLGPQARAGSAEWSAGVEPWPADELTADVWASAAAACDAVVVVDSTVIGTPASTQPPDPEPARLGLSRAALRQRLWVRPNWVDAAPQRASGREGEGSPFQIVETDIVYGAAEDPLTLFVIMMRSLPAIPTLSDTFRLRPIWHEDFAEALVHLATSSPDAATVVSLTGPRTVTSGELYDAVAPWVDRQPLRIPLPDFLADYGSRLAEALGVSGPVPPALLAFATHARGSERSDEERLASLLGRSPKPLEEGIRTLLRELNEVTPGEGFGTLEVKRFSVEVRRTPWDHQQLLRQVRMQFAEVMPVPVGVEPVAPATTVNPGDVLTLALPGRGHVQVRVEEVDDDSLVLGTLRGHVVAGIVRFATTPLEPGVRFEVMTCDRAANVLDWVGLTLAGARIQDANWLKVVSNVAALAGDPDAPVTSDSRRLDADEARAAERWIAGIIERQRRTRHERSLQDTEGAHRRSAEFEI